MNKYYKIAGLSFQICCERSMPYVEMRMAEYESASCEPDISVRLVPADNIPPVDARIYGGRALRFYETADGSFGFFSGNDGTVTRLMHSDAKFRRITVTVIDKENTDIIFFAYLGMAFEMGAALHERIVLHSSALIYQNRAVAFSAPPETGKSTHTRLWKKVFGDDVTIVNDDKPAISFSDGKAILHGTPWAGSTGVNANMSAPLAAAVFLNRGEKNVINHIPIDVSIKLFLEETPKPVIPRLTPAYLDLAGQLIESVPSYELFCNISDEAAIISKNGIFN